MNAPDRKWWCPFCGEEIALRSAGRHYREAHPPERPDPQAYRVTSIDRAAVHVRALAEVYFAEGTVRRPHAPRQKAILSWAQGLNTKAGGGGPGVEWWAGYTGREPDPRVEVTCPACKARGVVIGYSGRRARTCMACGKVVTC